ncbi:hypothetical protein TNCT_617491 [Trichonephila clavata]|uniref:Uncharacterized protein n=1 Tax=Trichonephila clavata TaxID=2740835 RepID=A0A8X6GMC6_TRICU|nr:hypothetical protein TNCT_617491 [Trichonephila clavata]
MCGRKLCWNSFVLWASTSNVQLFLNIDTQSGDYVEIHVEDSKDSVVGRVNDTRECARADATMAFSRGSRKLYMSLLRI